MAPSLRDPVKERRKVIHVTITHMQTFCTMCVYVRIVPVFKCVGNWYNIRSMWRQVHNKAKQGTVGGRWLHSTYIGIKIIFYLLCWGKSPLRPIVNLAFKITGTIYIPYSGSFCEDKVSFFCSERWQNKRLTNELWAGHAEYHVLQHTERILKLSEKQIFQ